MNLSFYSMYRNNIDSDSDRFTVPKLIKLYTSERKDTMIDQLRYVKNVTASERSIYWYQVVHIVCTNRYGLNERPRALTLLNTLLVWFVWPSGLYAGCHAAEPGSIHKTDSAIRPGKSVNSLPEQCFRVTTDNLQHR